MRVTIPALLTLGVATALPSHPSTLTQDLGTATPLKDVHKVAGPRIRKALKGHRKALSSHPSYPSQDLSTATYPKDVRNASAPAVYPALDETDSYGYPYKSFELDIFNFLNTVNISKVARYEVLQNIRKNFIYPESHAHHELTFTLKHSREIRDKFPGLFDWVNMSTSTQSDNSTTSDYSEEPDEEDDEEPDEEAKCWTAEDFAKYKKIEEEDAKDDKERNEKDYAEDTKKIREEVLGGLKHSKISDEAYEIIFNRLKHDIVDRQREEDEKDAREEAEDDYRDPDLPPPCRDI